MVLSPELEYLAYTNNSILRKVNPVTKLLILACMLLINLKITAAFQVVFLFVIIGLFFVSKISFYTVKRPIFAAFFVGIVLFIAKLHLFKIGIPYHFIVDFYPEAFSIALNSGLKVVCGVALILVFVSTTPLNEILSGLIILKVPKTLIEIFLVIYKYIFIINDEGIRAKNAQMVRLGYKNFKCSLESFGNLAGIIITKGASKGANMVDALLVRGYRGDFFFPSSVNRLFLLDYVLITLLGFFPLILSYLWMP